MLPNLTVKAIQDPHYFTQPHLQIHLPSNHNEWHTHHVFAPMALPSLPLDLLLNFQGSVQKPPSSRKYFSDRFLMNVPLLCFPTANPLPAYLLFHWSIIQFHCQSHSSLPASLPYRKHALGRHRPCLSQLSTPHLDQWLGYYRHSIKDMLKWNKT